MPDREAPSILTGIAFFAVLTLVYNLALWGLVQLLHRYGVIGWSLKWDQSAIIVLILMSWRMVDRAAFNREL